jgi:hypothetical protein
MVLAGIVSKTEFTNYQRKIVVKRPKKVLRLALFAIAATMLLHVFPSTTSAAPQCDVQALYAAITAANLNTNQHKNNVIQLFPGCIYTLNRLALQVSSTITIHGNGATVDGASSSPVFVVANTGNLTLNNLKVTNGLAPIGAGITNAGTLTLNSSSVSQNTSLVGPGIVNYGGTVTLNGSSTVTGNTALANGGGIYNGFNDSGGTVTLNGGSSVNGNTASGTGGGIYNNGGTVTLNGSSTVTGNTAVIDGGGIFNDGGGTVRNPANVFNNTPNNIAP